jgi:predicted RNA-binding Zn ribbon-like protein
VTSSALERVSAVREGLRGLITDRDRSGSSPGDNLLNQAIAGAALEIRLTSRGPELVPVGPTPLDRALGSLLATAVVAMIDGTWLRLKVCPGPGCGWVFYDHSRNNSGRWCSMKICGGREKSRAHYHRRREG